MTPICCGTGALAALFDDARARSTIGGLLSDFDWHNAGQIGRGLVAMTFSYAAAISTVAGPL